MAAVSCISLSDYTCGLHQRAPIYEATCSPCLVIGTAGAAIRIFAAYFADRIYRTHLCDFALDVDEHHDTRAAALAAKVRVIRNTARMLREMYARVHVGAHLLPPNHTCRPHLLPRPAILMPVPAPLPVHLSLLERVTRGQNSYVFTGTLTLPARHGTDDSAQSSEPELPVHVKFVPEYSVAAHRLLAAHTDPTSGAPRPLAPQLYWAGQVDIVPGLWMTVMETLVRWDADMPEDGVDGSEGFALPESRGGGGSRDVYWAAEQRRHTGGFEEDGDKSSGA
ncbi:hypothetical protein GSI_03516 [Ganoderma sinense ZZ0214-1]|uniref:Uncharacterized protein n=1 Tax=Ganoderma sinense ZZ0214-1 TaxID=1077348 RepID=A0A2G8SLT5_9APHY|nr:hypothetical protein GSI_03516 [Ganoderma sinense ZZ0214-1]